MPTVTTTRYSNGVKTVISEREVSQEVIDKFCKRVKETKEKAKERADEAFAKVPAINWEILRFANNHTFEEVLAKYPDNEEFVRKIVW